MKHTLVLLVGLLLTPQVALHAAELRSDVYLTGTRLEPGPLQSAMSANVKYLLANSNVDDMLWLFRRLADTPNPPGKKRGWEHNYPAHAAQFLMGAGNTLRWQSQPELRQRMNQLMEGIEACQTGDGRLLVPGVGSKLDKQWGYSMQMFAHGMVAAARSGNADAYHLVLEGRKNEGDTFAGGPVPSQRHTCCEGNGTWLYGNLPEYLFSADGDGLIVNLYHPAMTTWREGERTVRVSVETRFPADGHVSMKINAATLLCLCQLQHDNHRHEIRVGDAKRGPALLMGRMARPGRYGVQFPDHPFPIESQDNVA